MPDYPISDKDKAIFRDAIKKLDNGVISRKKEEKDERDKKEIREDLQSHSKAHFNTQFSSLKTWKASQSDSIVNASTIRTLKNSAYLSDYYTETVESHSLISYFQSSLSPKRFQKFIKEKIHWDAKLDLHGLNTDLAKDRLINFILEQSSLSNRFVLIIHGKGGQYSPVPILKNLVNHWLRQFPQVLAFRSALAKDGGAGAVYVLLKK